ncbi:MAG: hypothetical protein MJ081_00040 [Ruminococcus sp.]|nr:hypothetical protein [Ruminococcus sp.]
MKKISSAILSAALVFAVSTGINANAATVDDVAAAARAMGYSEDLIQEGYNMYYSNPSAYTSEELDDIVRQIYDTGSAIVSTVPYNPNYTAPTTTTVTTTSAAENTPVTETIPPQNDLITLTMPDGSAFTRISEDDFINMSYNDKMAYLSSFTPDKQQVIINNLSPLEYRSLMKQSPADKKLEIVDSLSAVAAEMGINLTVEDISDDNLTLSARNEEGTLVGISDAKVKVENTGYDRRGLFVGILLSVSAAFGALIFVLNKCFGKDDNLLNGK